MSSRRPRGKPARASAARPASAESAAATRDARLRAVWDAAESACYICDGVRGPRGGLRDFRICDVNAAGVRLCAGRAQEIVGRHLSDCFPSLWPAARFVQELRVLESGLAHAEECRLEVPGAGERCFEKLVVRSGEGIALFLRDITERKQTADLISRWRRELVEAQRMGRIGSWLWDVGSDEVIWSHELYRIAGRDPAEPPPRYVEHACLYRPESWERLRAAVEACLATGQGFELELEMVRPDGGTRWTVARGESGRDRAGRIVLLRGTLQDIDDRKVAELGLKALPQRILEAQETERRQVARELHDGVSQLLASALYRLHALENGVPATWRAGAAAAGNVVRQALTEVRQISHGLRPRVLDDLGLDPALRALARELRLRTGMRVTLRLPAEDEVPRLPPLLEQAVYRIAQEALTNIERHAAARSVILRLLRLERGVRLSIRDDGCGPRATGEEQAPATGLGLRHMQERAQLAGGTFALKSAPGGGTIVVVELPLPLSGPPVNSPAKAPSSSVS